MDQSTFMRMKESATAVISLLAIVTPIALGFFILTRDSDVSSQYIVYTAMRTRDSWQPNLFPVSSPDLDAYARPYGCMMDAEIGRGAGQCATQESIKEFQTCIRARPAPSQCDQFIGGSQSDLELLKCLQRNYDVTVRQTNVFLECLTLSQPATFHSIQSLDSTVFLGSYNYAVLLVDALTVMVSFIVLTSGGWFYVGSVSRYQPKDNHIYGVWSPFSVYRIVVAWAWNVFGFIIAVGVAYSNGDFNFANKEDIIRRFPVTLWTCVLSIGVFAIAVAFYTFYAAEWMGAGGPGAGVFYASSAGAGPPESQAPMVGPDPVIVSMAGGGQTGAASMFQGSSRRRPDPRLHASALTRRFPSVARWHRGLGGYVGVQIYGDVAPGAEIEAADIMPLMLQAFAWTWVLTDGLFFVGMLTSQSSVTNETAVGVFISVTAARLFQLAAAYFAYRAYIKDNVQDTEKKGVVLACVLAHAASLICISVAALNFMSTRELSRVASLPTSGFPSYFAVQICFLLLVVIAPEVWRAINLLIPTIHFANFPNGDKLVADNILISAEALFTWEWVARIIFAVVAIVPLADAVKGQQTTLTDFLLGTV